MRGEWLVLIAKLIVLLQTTWRIVVGASSGVNRGGWTDSSVGCASQCVRYWAGVGLLACSDEMGHGFLVLWVGVHGSEVHAPALLMRALLHEACAVLPAGPWQQLQPLQTGMYRTCGRAPG